MTTPGRLLPPGPTPLTSWPWPLAWPPAARTLTLGTPRARQRQVSTRSVSHPLGGSGGRPLAPPGPVESTRAELLALGYGEPSRGCPPCSGAVTSSAGAATG